MKTRSALVVCATVLLWSTANADVETFVLENGRLAGKLVNANLAPGNRRDRVNKPRGCIAKLVRALVRRRAYNSPAPVRIEENALGPDALALAKRLYEGQHKWSEDLKMWRSWVTTPRHAKAIANIRAIQDPAAAMALGELLATEREVTLRLEYVQVLGRLPGVFAKAPLIKAAIDDPNEAVSVACLKKLRKEGAQQAVRYFVRALNPQGQKDNFRINRAAIALAWMNDKEAIPALIEAVVTRHVMKVYPVPNPGAGGVASGGGTPKSIVSVIVNKKVIAALRTLTGQDFGTDKDAWRKWYVDANTPRDVNLRRSK